MANELWHSYEEGKTIYALIWKKTDDKVFDQADGGDTFETYVEANIDNYDVAMTNQGDGASGYSDYYTADFPSVIVTAGVYRIQILLRVGGTINADNDIVIAQGEFYWNGDREIDGYADYVDKNTVVNVYDDRDGGVGREGITSTGRLVTEGGDC